MKFIWKFTIIRLIDSFKFYSDIQVARIYVTHLSSPLRYMGKSNTTRKTRCHVFEKNQTSQGSCNSSFQAMNPLEIISFHYNLNFKRFWSNLLQKARVLKAAGCRGKLKQKALVGFVRMVVGMVFVMAISFTVSTAPSCMY